MLKPSCIEAQIGGHAQLAALATCESVRRMHEELEQFYRTQLIVALAQEHLGAMLTSSAQNNPGPLHQDFHYCADA